MIELSQSEAFLAALKSARRVLLTGPMDPDGDSLGACLALAQGLAGLVAGKIDVAGTPAFRYAWMPGADQMVPDASVAGPYDIAIVLDGDARRLDPTVELAYQGAVLKGIIDHHRSTQPEGYDLAIIAPDAASTCELVRELLARWGVALDADLAALIYTGLIFDTGGFRHSNTRPDTHRLAAELLETGIEHAAIFVRVLVERRRSGLRLLSRALDRTRFYAADRVALGSVSIEDLEECGATQADLEGVVDALLYTAGVELACLAIEKDASRVKLSLRSRREVDVARLARSLAPGGGGHARAAGVLMGRPLALALEELPGRLQEALGG